MLRFLRITFGLFCLVVISIPTEGLAFTRISAGGVWKYWPSSSIPVPYWVNLNPAPHWHGSCLIPSKCEKFGDTQ